MPLSPSDVPAETVHPREGAPARLRAWWDRTRSWWKESTEYRFFIPALLLILSLTLYSVRLSVPEKYFFDEILFAYTAGEYVEGNADAYQWDHPCSVAKSDVRCAELFPASQQGSRVGKYEWTHPPLGKLFISAGILAFGNDPVGWRIASAVMGAIGVVVAYVLGFMVTGRRSVGILLAGFLLLDGMYFVYARMGLMDIFLTVLTMTTLLSFAWYLKAPLDRTRLPLLMTGLLMGMSISVKWSGAFGGVFIGLAVLWRVRLLLRKLRSVDGSPEADSPLRAHLLFVSVALFLIPLSVYLVSYLPFFFAGGMNVADFIDLQKSMLHFQSNMNDNPATSSRWWAWPLDLRSVWLGTRSYANGDLSKTYVLGNPLLYWAFQPAVAWTIVRWWRSGQHLSLVVLMIGFLGQWLPWMFVGRSTYLYHFLPAVPFGCLAVAASVVRVVERWGDWRRTLAIQYVVLVVVAFAFFYPILSYYPLSERALGLRMWLASWV